MLESRDRAVPKTVKRVMRGMSLALCLTVPSLAMAFTECNSEPTKFYVGDNSLYVALASGGVGVIDQSDQDFKATLAVVTTAVATQKAVVIRYAETGLNCASAAHNIVGIWLLR
jgi:hypothetical protein